QHAAIAALALQADRRAEATIWARLPSGWRNNPSTTQRVVLDEGTAERVVTYAISRRGAVSLAVDGEPVEVELHSTSSSAVDATVNGVRRRARIAISA